MYFIYSYENRIMISVKIILSRGGKMRKNDGEDESNQGTL
jgi:hypothetical protein